MTTSRIRIGATALRFAAMLATAAIGAGLLLGLPPAFAAEDVTKEQIVRALAIPKAPLTRGVSMAPPAEQPAISPVQDKFLQTVRGRSSRSLSSTERDESAAMATAK